MFSRIDTDGNQVLTPDELYPLIVELGEGHPLAISEKHCKMFGSLFDKNNDGVISKREFSEYARFLFVYMVLNSSPEIAQEVMALQQQEDEIEAQIEAEIEIMEGEFRMNDNLIRLRENVDTVDSIFPYLPTWLQDLVMGEGFGDYCDEMFNKVDADGNGSLSPDEMFNKVDADGN